MYLGSRLISCVCSKDKSYASDLAHVDDIRVTFKATCSTS